MKTLISAIFLSLLLSAPTLAQSTTSAPSQAAQSAPAMTDMVEGEVRKVDKVAREITLRHGEIKQLDMPAMTMVFPVKDRSLLNKVKAGDKVKFRATVSGGALTIAEIEPVK